MTIVPAARGGWRALHVGVEGDGLAIGGLAVWQQPWRAVDGEPLLLPHPGHCEQRHPFRRYEIGPAEVPLRFAAAELSNGVWGFYVPH